MAGAFKQIKEHHRQTTLGAKEGLAFRVFSRPVASFMLYCIQNSRITPNQVTIASLLVGIAGAIVHMTVLSYGGLLLGGALFMGAHVLDALDGQLARHRKAGSTVGMHFDFFIDELKAYLMFGALAVRLYLQHQDPDNGFSLLQPLVDWGGPEAIILFSLVGLGGLSIGISCTQFMKLQSWKEAFPPAPPPAEGEAPPSGSGSLSPVAMAENVGHFIVDYPSYIILLCALDRADVYLILYSLTVCAYSVKALFGISLKLWRVNPYKKTEAEEVTPATESDD